MHFSPKFRQLMELCNSLENSGKGDTEEAWDIFHQALQYAPPEFTEMMRQKAIELGLMPKPHGYTPDGQPLYNLSEVQELLGIKDEDVPDCILKGAYEGPIHRTQ